ncbi:CaiB/BaiF CoA transferase family protein [Salinarimonas rosea]|uniref:CaiB/BaiF CoA transferase family protein n=1 Tax=Salinarimonas rosea TaxID=552063 RepID=UPI000423A278|nr:CoA transferase [Salinarimonas rosea]
MSAALDGIKVLDLSRYIAGPFCAQALGDLGADVVKVERIDGGEEGRRVGETVEGDTLFFLSTNRNKRGVAVDFRDPEGLALVRRLALAADIVVENFRPGTMEAMGLGWDALAAENPGLVMVRISGFGQEGPLARHPCFDGAAQAHSGIMAMTGAPGGPPTMAGVFVCDYATALYGAMAALAALQARARTGRGQVVEATLMDSGLSMLTTAIPERILFGREPDRRGNRDRYLSPSHCFQARDGAWIYVVAGSDAHFPRLAAAMEMPGLAADPRFAHFAARNENVAALERIIEDWAAGLDGETILHRLHEAEVTAERVATIGDVVENPQVAARGMIVDVPHPALGSVPFPAPAMKLHATPTTIRRGAPGLGEHAAEVLAEWLGMDDREVARLAEAGTI